MSLYRFYVEGCSNASDKIYISGKDQNHIKNVLRLRIGEEIIVSDGTSRDYHCRISDYPENMVEAEIIDITENATELPAEVVLFQGMPKADKFEHIIQKTVELGVHEIYPVMMKRCVVKLEGGNGTADNNGFLTISGKEAKKIQRYNNIAEAAAKQSQRGIIPEVKSFVSLKRAAEIASQMNVVLVPYESAEGMEYSRGMISEIKKMCAESSKRPSVAVFIGPEGGFAQEEVDLLSEKGGKIISLGRRILRTETAGPAIMSVLGFSLDE